jgi:hypothetical protein
MKPLEVMKPLEELMQDYALVFAGRMIGEGEIAFPESLDRAGLDQSLESLKIVDVYLDYAHANLARFDDGMGGGRTVFRCGAYVGVVIQRTFPGVFHWVEYDEYVRRHPKLAKILGEETTATCLMLCDAEDSMTMPLNKVARYLREGGAEHCTHWYASTMRKEWTSVKT